MDNVPLSVPEGVFPFFMSNSGAEKQGLKNGPALIDLIPSKSFQKALVIDDIKTYGFMCAFEPCRKMLEECNLIEFTIICDPTSKYGEMFLLLHTKGAIESFEAATAAETCAAEEVARKEAEALNDREE